MISSLKQDISKYYCDLKAQDFAFWMVCSYLIFSYVRPQVIIPALGFLPWTQISILLGLSFLLSKGKASFQSVHWSTLIFFLIILASSYNATWPEISFKKIDTVPIWLVEIFFFTNCVRTLEQYRVVIIFFFILLFKMSLFGAKTWTMRGFGFTKWGIAGPDGFFANSGEYSLLMAMLAIMSISFIVSQPNIRKFYYVLPITAVMTVLGASSRGSQLAIAIGLLLFGLIVGKLKVKNLFVIGVVIFLVMTYLPEEQKKRFDSMGEDGTSESRLLYWEKGLDMLSNHKLLGVGYLNFAEYFHVYYKDPSDFDSEYLYKRKEVAHNSVIETASELGYPGGITYLWFHLLCYILHRKSRRILVQKHPQGKKHWVHKFSIGMDITLITYFVGAFFMSVAFYPYIYLMMMLSQSMYNCVRRECSNLEQQRTTISNTGLASSVP